MNFSQTYFLSDPDLLFYFRKFQTKKQTELESCTLKCFIRLNAKKMNLYQFKNETLHLQEFNKYQVISEVKNPINTNKSNQFIIISKMHQEKVWILIILLVVSQCDQAPEAKAAAEVVAQRAAKIPVIVWPPVGSRCCNTHNIYALDTSGSMWGLSWSKALAYLTSVSGSSDYTSLFTHGGTWLGPPFQVTNYLDHVLNAVIPPVLPSPNGDTDYDDALIRAIAILNKAYPERTCITFISDGWEEIYNSPVANVIQEFLDARKKFQKKTGCPVCVKCYQTQDYSGGLTNFQKFCREIGVRVTFLKALLDVDVPKYAQFTARAKLVVDPKDNGPRPDSIKGPK